MQVRFLPAVIRKKIRKEEKQERTGNRTIVEAQEAQKLRGQHRKKYSMCIVSLESHSPLLAFPEYNYLSVQYPELRPFLLQKEQKSTLQWSDPASSYTLTKVLLHHLYGIKYWQMDYSQHLVPMLGQRHNYLHWVMGQFNFYFGFKTGFTLLDIGCGVSAIFGILALKGFQAKQVICSDIDQQVLQSAQRIVDKNGLAISLRLQPNAKEYLGNVLRKGEEVEVVVCNPPFFSDLKEQFTTEYRESHLTSKEGECEGGECAFVTGLFQESKAYRQQVRVFSCMIGVKRHFDQLKDFFIERLQQGEILRLQMAKLEQGQNARWAILWLLE